MKTLEEMLTEALVGPQKATDDLLKRSETLQHKVHAAIDPIIAEEAKDSVEALAFGGTVIGYQVERFARANKDDPELIDQFARYLLTAIHDGVTKPSTLTTPSNS